MGFNTASCKFPHSVLVFKILSVITLMICYYGLKRLGLVQDNILTL